MVSNDGLEVPDDATANKSPSAGPPIGLDNALTRRHHSRCHSPPDDVSSVSTPKQSQPPSSSVTEACDGKSRDKSAHRISPQVFII